MKLSKRLGQEQAYVQGYLRDSLICSDCSATLTTFAEACTADLDDPCPGYLAIERARTEFAKLGGSR